MSEPKPVVIQAHNQFKNAPLAQCTHEQLLWLAMAGRYFAAEHTQQGEDIPSWLEKRLTAIDALVRRG